MALLQVYMGIWTPHYIKENYSCHSLNVLYILLPDTLYINKQVGLQTEIQNNCREVTISVYGLF